MAEKDWFKKTFSKDYISIYQHRDEQEAAVALDHLLENIPLPKLSLCLDIGCGFGRHLSYLNKRGISTFGIDLSEDLLDLAVESKYSTGRIVRGDMRSLPFLACFDAVFSFFSSFGYFLEDSENQLVLEEISRVLKPKGTFLIDFLNPWYVKNHLKSTDHQILNGLSVTQRRWINTTTNTVEKELIIEDKDGKRTLTERVKLYDLSHFQQFCRNSGLNIVKTLGNYKGEPYHKHSERLIVIGGKCGCPSL